MSEVLIDSYDPVTKDVNALFVGTFIAQSFMGQALKLTKAKFYISNVPEETAVGTICAKLYAHSGSFGDEAVPTGEALATSATVNLSVLTESLQLIEFVFSDEYVMSADTPYFIALQNIDSEVPFLFCLDYDTMTHEGNMAEETGLGWYGFADGEEDLLFYVYGEEATPPDTTPPVITLLGESEVNVEVGSSYEDAGATAEDDVDGDITGDIVVGGDTVDTDTPGTYVITYNVSDAALNPAEEVTRTVNVVDTTKPVITRLGLAEVTVEVKSSYTDSGATATDNYDGDITGSIVTVNPVNINVIGDYTVTYNVEDSSNNAAIQVTRTVHVVDTTPPVITRLGSATVNISVGDTYTDAGATALDNYDGDITGDIVTVNPVNTAVADTYTVTYNVSDSSDNPATEVTRTVVVAAVEVTKRKNSLKIKML